jgi:putative peptide zinc metalloprotease protein
MTSYPPDAVVRVRPFTHRRNGDTVTVGDIERGVFLEIPAEGLDILDALSAGRTVGETVRLFEQKHGETPDIEDFLVALDDEGFLGGADAVPTGARTLQRSVSLERLSPELARRLVGVPVLVVLGLAVAAGVILAIDDPGILPNPTTAFSFPMYFAALTWSTVAITLVGVVLHELAHVVGARAAGVPARIGISNQLYTLVAHTDMTAIWLAPRRQRYRAFVIGAVVDAVGASFVIALIWAGRHGLVPLPRWLSLLTSAVLMTYFIRIGWQFFFYLRTDVYYVIATAFRCSNLLGDTEDFLRNKLAWLVRSKRRIDQSAIPTREMRVIRVYSVLWLVGRFLAILSFIGIGATLLVFYGYQLVLWITGQHSRFGSVDFATLAVLTFAVDGGGLVLWLRSLYRGARERRRRYVRAAARATGGRDAEPTELRR